MHLWKFQNCSTFRIASYGFTVIQPWNFGNNPIENYEVRKFIRLCTFNYEFRCNFCPNTLNQIFLLIIGLLYTIHSYNLFQGVWIDDVVDWTRVNLRGKLSQEGKGRNISIVKFKKKAIQTIQIHLAQINIEVCFSLQVSALGW